MQGLPFEIPQSLSTYLTQFENDPEKGIANLEAFLRKRGMDAVGYFLLSWLYHKNQQQDEAIHYALKAKCSAPGSPFFQHLHYFLIHPDHFEAWKPFASDTAAGEEVETGPASQTALNLDQIIEQLGEAENNRITITPDFDDDRNLGEKSEMVGDIASETLAMIYEKQKKYSDALRTFNKLIKTRPHKADFYQQEIERIRREMNRTDQES